tara:strand:+ start:3858 stop:4952 length:1095 start_codon:yes stop_codon:yes gene_type:complete
MNKNKLLFLIQLPPPVHGSALVNKLLMTHKQIQNKYQVDVVPTQLANTMEDLGNFSIKKVWNGFLIFYNTILKLLTKRYDLVYLTLSPLSFAFYKDAVLVLMAKSFGNKVVLHLHGKGIKDEIKSRFKKRIYKMVFKNTDVIVLAETLYSDVSEIYSKTPYVLPNGIIDSPFKDSNTEKNLNRTSFTYLSNLTKDKGIYCFLEAINLLKSRENEFFATIAGPSADVSIEEVNEYIQKHNLTNVSVKGAVYGKEKYQVLNDSDVFVLPSLNECFPLTILEAYQAELAVISTSVGAIPDIVKNRENGFVIEPKNSKLLAEKMSEIMGNHDLLKSMKLNNKKEYKENYTEEIFIKNFITIIDEILKK